MLITMQTEKAQEYHQNLETSSKSCISCHVGIAHPEFADGLQTAMD
jgi:nitrate/TMAO reductase-like tetraheme cytochrome c subunit